MKFEETGSFCAVQANLASTVHKHAGVPFHGFEIRDVALRYNSAFMPMAYKNSTPKDVQLMFHMLAEKETAGPKLRIPIPDTMPIEDRQTILSARHRILNYKAGDIGWSMYDNIMTNHGFVGLMSQHQSQNQDEEENMDALFEELTEAIRGTVSDYQNKIFDTAINDNSFQYNNGKTVKTRDTMKQHIEECCAICDEMGDEAKQKYEELHNEFRTWVNKKRNEHLESKRHHKKLKHVPMTNPTYTKKEERIYNTQSMG